VSVDTTAERTGKTALLGWVDAGRRPLEEKVRAAAARYKERFGREANVCFVSSGEEDGTGGGKKIGGVRIQAVPYLPPGHFLVGWEEEGQDGG